MDVFTVYYADGSTENTWNNKGDVVAVVVYGGEYQSATRNGYVKGRYKTLHYQDEDDAEPGQFYFWMFRNKVYSGFNPKGTRVKASAPVADYDHIFRRL